MSTNGERIDIRGARVHNLKNVDLEFEKNRLICFTGVSGSGKSSMAFDTIYAEGQRRYVESLSAYARQFMDQMEKPDVDRISGLAPTISIEQKSAGKNPRSTVGTMTEIHDYLRVLYARLGVIHCVKCGKPVGAQSTEQTIDRILAFDEGSRLVIMAPVVRGRQGEFLDLFEDLQRQGFVRARVDGQVIPLAEDPGLARHMKHDIDVVVDRVIMKPDIRSRIAEAVTTALEMGNGTLIVNRSVDRDEEGEDVTLGTLNACCGITYEEPTPQLFSFNVPSGMCQTCSGLGMKMELNPELLIPDETKSLREGAIRTVNPESNKWHRCHYEGVLAYYGNADLDTPWKDIPEPARHKLLHGLDGERLRFTYRKQPTDDGWQFWDTYSGIIPAMEQKYQEAKADKVKEELGSFMSQVTCPDCGGTRLRAEARAVRLKGVNLPELADMPVDEARAFLVGLDLTETEKQIGQDALLEIRNRLEFLLNVGLRYISLGRGANTLSGGEAQRIRLASQIGSGLVGVLYVLDEPSIGLHHRDNHRLLNALSRLRDMGNTVIVVEHDEDTMRAADEVVDFGPGPGIHGGEIVVHGSVDEVCANKRSITGQFLSGVRTIPVPEKRRPLNGKWLEIRDAVHNNLKSVTVRIPLGLFTCVTGVSGSGKSSLITDTLLPALDRLLYRGKTRPGKHGEIIGLDQVDKVIDIDQSPIGRTPRSNPATYTKLLDPIRRLFADLPQSKVRGYAPGRFSFNVKAGRCEACDGHGAMKVEMDFLADVWVSCPVCEGARFNAETLMIRFKGKTIAEVLNMDVQEALGFFENIPSIARILKTLSDVGLDYIKLGQPSTTLSGGEAQRVKLAKELCRRSTGKTVYILDEPTTGLHFHDTSHLLNVLHRFCDEENTVIVIEHNMDVIKTADWIIDMGPEGGEDGGYVVACGSPEEIAGSEESWTGQVLKQVFETGRTGGLEPVHAVNGNGRNGKNGGNSGALLALDSDTYKPVNRVTDISVVGAREHNLKNVSVTIPREKLVVFSGVSGSGKTSMALDTIYAEGQRRYVESLSAYARQFLGQMQKPRVDHVEGLSPAIAIEQKATSKNPRSTVGTVTEVYDYLRVIFAQLSEVYCPDCQVPAVQQSSSEVVGRILSHFDGQRIVVLAPVEPAKGEDHDAILHAALSDGYLRARIDNEIVRLEQDMTLDRRRTHTVEIVIDRLAVKKEDAQRIGEAVEAAFSRGVGRLIVLPVDEGEELPISQHLSCPSCSRSFDRLTPQMFAFNRAHDISASGMCPACQGLGTQQGLAEDVIVTDPDQSINDGAISLWGKPTGQFRDMLKAAGAALGFDLTTPLSEFTAAQKDVLLYGSPNRWVTLREGFRFQYQGLLPGVDRTLKAVPQVRDRLGHVLAEVPCGVCGGSRLVPESRYARLKNVTIGEVTSMPISECRRFFEEMDLDENERMVVGEVHRELINRIRFLDEVGLDYVTLDRRAPTLSGGEAQRIRLASQIGSGLTGVLYVLDEPTIGLHPRDNRRLLGALNRLRDLNNTVIVVEHDEDTLNAADHVVDFGPGAGSSGGEIVASTQTVDLPETSLTGQYLKGVVGTPLPAVRRVGTGKQLVLKGARQNNLKNIDVKLPLGTFTVVTGVSGSGKSTLLIDTLHNVLAAKLHRARVVAGLHDSVRGISNVDKAILIDQEPIGNSPLSNPATYSGVFDSLRQLYAQMPVSKVRGYTARRFSTNVPGGRCERCWGYGQRHIEMHFLPDVWVECEECGGMRYNRETLDVLFDGKSIGDVLRMPVGEALAHFGRVPKVQRVLQRLVDVGLGYLELGRSAPTLSGGEAQRLKLARELARPATGKTVYIMDEPTTGLHFADVDRLLAVINKLVDRENTVLVIEHNLAMIKSADWIIDLGPEGGGGGGRIVAEGTPEDVAACPESHTGKILQEVLRKSRKLDSGDSIARTASPIAKEVHDADIVELEVDPDPDDTGKRPWQVGDGKAFHLAMERERRGGKAAWSASTLEWLARELEAVGPCKANWKNHFGIVFNPKKPKTRPGFWTWVATTEAAALDLNFHVPTGQFEADAVAKWLSISRDGAVRVEERDEWSELKIAVIRRKEIDTAAFRTLLQQIFTAFIEKAAVGGKDGEPWKKNGHEWHMDPKRERQGREFIWEPELLDFYAEQVAEHCNQKVRWNNKLVVGFTHRGPRTELYVQVHTHLWGRLRLDITQPKGFYDTDAIARRLGLKPYSEVDAIPLSGQWSRVVLDDHHKHLTIIRIFGCARNEINEDEFAAFLGECYRNSAEAAGIDIDARRPHLVSSTPWKDDGRTWHTDPDRERKRRKPVWEPEALTWVMDLVDTMGDGEVRWDSRGSVSYAPKGKSYWLRVGTDDWKSFRMTFRTPKGSFDGQKLRKALAIPPFDDVETVPFGGDSSRVRMNGRGKDWTRVEIQGCLKSEIDTPAFCDFLRECHDRFIGAASVD